MRARVCGKLDTGGTGQTHSNTGVGTTHGRHTWGHTGQHGSMHGSHTSHRETHIQPMCLHRHNAPAPHDRATTGSAADSTARQPPRSRPLPAADSEEAAPPACCEPATLPPPAARAPPHAYRVLKGGQRNEGCRRYRTGNEQQICRHVLEVTQTHIHIHAHTFTPWRVPHGGGGFEGRAVC